MRIDANKLRIALFTGAAAMALGGCGSHQLTRPQVAEKPISATEVEATRIGVTCEDVKSQGADGQDKGAIVATGIGLVAPIAADFAVKLGKSLLERAQKNRNAVYAATGVMETSVMEDCTPQKVKKAPTLTLTRAVFNGSDTMDYPGFKLTGTLAFERIPPKEKPSANGGEATGASGKGAPEKAEERISVRFKPTELVYGRRAPKTKGSGRKHVVALLSFSEGAVFGSGAPTGDEKLPSPLRIDLGTLHDGRTYSAELLTQGEAATVIPAFKSANIVVSAIVFETEDELLALQALTDAYSDNADKLAEALTRALGGSGQDAGGD